MKPPTARPVILAACDDPEDMGRIERELRTRYEADYLIVSERAAASALGALRRLKDLGDEVALVLGDQQIGDGRGVEFLARVRETYPTAKRLLLTPATERSGGVTLPRAMALGRIDYFEPKPGPPPNETFHRIVTDLLEEWGRPRRFERRPAVRIVGGRRSPRCYELRDLFGRYMIPRGFGAGPGALGGGETDRGRAPGARHARRTGARRSVERGGRRRLRGRRRPPQREELRPARRRRRAGGAGRLRLGGVRGALDPRRGGGGRRRAGGHQFPDPQLPRLRAGRQRPGARQGGLLPGVAFRRELQPHAQRHEPASGRGGPGRGSRTATRSRVGS